MKKETIHASEKQEVDTPKTDHLTVTEKDNITELNLIRYTLRVIYFLMGASYLPERFGKTWDIQKRKESDEFLMLNADQVIKCMHFSLQENISVELAEQILETAYRCGLVERINNTETGEKSYCMHKPDKPFRP